MVVRQASNRRDQLLHSAATLFSRQGYHGTSMQDLAKDLGILRGSLYAHIASKEDILFEIVDAGADRFISRLEEVVLSDLAPGEKIEKAILGHVMTVAEHLDAATVFLNDWRHLSPEGMALIQKKRDRYEALVRELIEEGVEWGEFPLDLNPKIASLALLSTMNWVYQWYDPKGSMTAEEIAAEFTKVVLGGFRGSNATSTGDQR